MAAKEIYDYVSTVTPDVDQTLSVSPNAFVREPIGKNDIIHLGDDGSEERIGLGGSGNIIPLIGLNYSALTESDAGTVLDFWCDSSKGDGMINSFKLAHPDNHTYVVRFAISLERLMGENFYSFGVILFKVLGRIEDT